MSKKIITLPIKTYEKEKIGLLVVPILQKY